MALRSRNMSLIVDFKKEVLPLIVNFGVYRRIVLNFPITVMFGKYRTKLTDFDVKSYMRLG